MEKDEKNSQEKTKAITAKSLTNDYMVGNKVADFELVPMYEKLHLLQNTPAQFVKTRKVGRTDVPYVEHSFAEKALNLAFNFRVSNEVTESGFREYKEDYYDYQSKEKRVREVVEAECMVKFTFTGIQGETIIRTVYSSHKGYKNPATTRGDVMKSAISKSWTVVARTFGIGADLKDREDKAMREVEAQEADMPPLSKAEKTFAPKY